MLLANAIGVPFGIVAALRSNECDVMEVSMPSDTIISESSMSATVLYSVGTNLSLDLQVSDKASYKVYSDASCATEITGALTLNVGANTVYIKVTAENGNSKVYTFSITRSVASSACSILEVIYPPSNLNEAFLAVTTVYFPKGTTSVIPEFVLSPGATWKLYSNYSCTKEITSKIAPVGFSYVKVFAETGASAVYSFTVRVETNSKDTNLYNINLPNGALISTNTVTANIPDDLENIVFELSLGLAATWNLYSDIECNNEISKTLSLSDVTIAYIKITAEDTAYTKIYTLILTKVAIEDLYGIDVTEDLEVWGQPFLNKGIYPANVWDMQVFNNKIYLGFGNSSNMGPSTNAGPIPIIYCDPQTGEFITEPVGAKNYVDEEQIDIYRVIDGKLYIPGHDSREAWSLGNYYVNDGDGWVKVRNIPDGVHVYDMVSFKGQLFAAIGSSGSYDLVPMSNDGGNTWAKIWTYPGYGARVYSLFEFKDKLHAVNVIYFGPSAPNTQILSFEQNSSGAINAKVVNVDGNKLVPGTVSDSTVSSIKMVRTNVVKDKLLFIAGRIYNDHHWTPVGLYASTDMKSSQKIILPELEALPMDILIRDNTAYVLAYVKMSGNKYVNLVYKSSDLTDWTEVLRFNSDTFARSFEEIDGAFYFGLGCYTDNLPSSTGTILRIKNINN